jgi:O-antigen/teichoic acid export membrane protein
MPDPVRRMGVNVAFKTVTELVNRFLSFLFYMALARWLGEAPFGLFNLLYSVGAIAALAVDPGINLSLIRLAPRREGYLVAAAGAALGLKLILAVGAVLLTAGYGALAGYDTPTLLLLALMGVNMVGFALTEYAAALFQARENMGGEAFLMGVGKLAVTVAALTALALGANLTITLAVMTLTQIGATAWAFRWAAGRGVAVTPAFDPARWGELLGDSLPLALLTVATVVFYRADIVVAPFLGVDMAPLGHYAAGIKLLDVWLAVPTLIMAALFPTLSRLAETDYPLYRRYALTAVAGLAAIGAVGAATGGLFAEDIVTLIFSDRFAPAGPTAAVLATAGMFMFIRHAFLMGLALEGKAGAGGLLALVGAIADLTLVIGLTPTQGIMGMAVAKLAADLLLSTLAGYVWITVGRRTTR